MDRRPPHFEVITTEADDGTARHGVLQIRNDEEGKVSGVVHYGPKSMGVEVTLDDEIFGWEDLRVCADQTLQHLIRSA
jgi:hypothetical protein